jgi:hypothetical protein
VIMSKPLVPAAPPTSSVPLDLDESVAGEEDPGASIEFPMGPRDEASPATGEDVCQRCRGSGKLAGRDCPECQGTGKMTAGTG